MATIGKVSAVFTASTGGLRTGINQATSSMSRMEASTRSLASNMRILAAIDIGRVFANAASFVANGVRSLIGYGQAQADVIDRTSKLAARLGMTYDELSGLALAGDLAGVSMDTIGAAVTRADVAFVKAAEGSKQARDAFAGIGLAVEDLNGLSAAERFDRIASAIAALPTEAERARAAVQLFGRSGAQLMPLFAGGANGIAEARAEAERFGLALTNAQGQDVEEMNDSFTRVKAAIEGVVQQVVAYLAPAITGIATQFTDFVGSIGGANIGQSIGEGIIAGARYLAEIGDYVIQSVPDVWQYVSEIGKQWQGVFEVGRRVFDFFAMVGREIEMIFKTVGSVLTGSVGRLLNAIGELAQFIPGFGATGQAIEKAGESAMRISRQLWEEAGTAAQAVADNTENLLFGRDKMAEAGEEMAGPLVEGLDAALARARTAAGEVSQAAAKPIEIKQAAAAESAVKALVPAVRQAVQGIDSRSSEGLATMFRIMRGDTGNDVQERIARAAERTADAVENDDADFEVFDLAAAAGA